MVLIVKRLLLWVAVTVSLAAALPAAAHTDHNKQQEAARSMADGHAAAPTAGTDMAMDDHGMASEERPTSLGGRFVSWLGRMHPFAVHFPIALIPASWLALLIARRRGHAAEVLRAVIVLAGVAAVAAALLGWFNAGFALADREPIQLYHRWIGTALAVVVGGIALWAWRRPEAVSSKAMTWTLGTTTLLLLVQGWLGAALTHGLDHMYF
ncbi:MAG: DUF2231 domain-containing protein [Sphingosinicella sp.]|uniref:DUF2231 domain-containing protein n=1 Tax=Sphingosinicella sp. TaxID=1917971 RepID=UPI0040379513